MNVNEQIGLMFKALQEAEIRFPRNRAGQCLDLELQENPGAQAFDQSIDQKRRASSLVLDESQLLRVQRKLARTSALQLLRLNLSGLVRLRRFDWFPWRTRG